MWRQGQRARHWLGRVGLAGIVIGASAAPGCAAGRLTPAQRESIHAMPLLERPDRPGHVYGNTVRWLHYGRRGANGRL